MIAISNNKSTGLGFKVDLSKSIATVTTLKWVSVELYSLHSVQSTLDMLLLGGLGACPQENLKNSPS